MMSQSKCIVWVTDKADDGGYGSYWHGWVRGLIFDNSSDAEHERDRIKHKHFHVEVVELK